MFGKDPNFSLLKALYWASSEQCVRLKLRHLSDNVNCREWSLVLTKLQVVDNFEDQHPNFRWTQQLPIKLKMFHFIPLSLGPELSLNIVKTSMKFHWHLHWLLAGKQFNFGLALLLLLHSRNVLGLGLQLGQPMAALRTGWDIAPSRPSLLVTFIVSVCSTAHHTSR